MHRFAEHAPWRKLVEEFVVGKKKGGACPSAEAPPKPTPEING
jgi:hypothetical protein